MARYVMTAKRKAALRKAQLASARRRRKSTKHRLYGKSSKTANATQRKNRKIRRAKRITNGIVYGYAGVLVAGSLAPYAQLRRMNADIAYNGKTKDGRFNAQGGPRFVRVKPTAAGARRRNRADFRRQHGRKALRQLKRNMKSQQRQQRRNVRNAVRYGNTTMSWGPRQTQTAITAGRRRQRGY